MDAGQLDWRVNFQSFVMIEDDMGGVVHSWEDRFTLWAHILYLRGSEAVMQARLVSKAPVIITVRRSAQSERITSEWRAIISGVIFALKEDPRPNEDGGFLEMLAEG